MKYSKLFLTTFLIISCIFLFCTLNAMAWTVAPVRFEVKAEKGKEYTLTFSVLNESQLYQKRFEIQTDDWIIDKNNNFLRKAYNKDIENKYSATPWIKVTPMQFVIPPGQTKNIRFTTTVPHDLPLNGEYSTGIFVGEKNIEKPPKGEKIIHIKQDTFIGVVIYVKIGEDKPVVILKDLKVDTKPIGKGLNTVTLLPVYESRGNVHSRGNVQVKVEPILNLEVKETKVEIVKDKDSKDLKNTKAESIEPQPEIIKKVPKSVDGGEVVVLRETEVTFPVDIPVPLPANSEWKFIVNSDFGGDTPILVGTKRYKVPYIEMPQEQKKEIPAKKAEEKKI